MKFGIKSEENPCSTSLSPIPSCYTTESGICGELRFRLLTIPLINYDLLIN